MEHGKPWKAVCDHDWFVICSGCRLVWDWKELCVEDELWARSPSPEIGRMLSSVGGGSLSPAF